MAQERQNVQGPQAGTAKQAVPDGTDPARVEIPVPAGGQQIVIRVQPGQVLDLQALDPSAITFSAEAGDLRIDFGASGSVVLQDFLTIAKSDAPPTLLVGGEVEVPIEALLSALAGGTTIEPAAGPASGSSNGGGANFTPVGGADPGRTEPSALFGATDQQTQGTITLSNLLDPTEPQSGTRSPAANLFGRGTPASGETDAPTDGGGSDTGNGTESGSGPAEPGGTTNGGGQPAPGAPDNPSPGAPDAAGGVPGSSGTSGTAQGPFADTPTLTAPDAIGGSGAAAFEDTPIALDIDASLNDGDGAETLTIRVEGVPAGAALSAGTDNADGTWTLAPEDLPGLTFTPAPDSDADVTLTVTATATETTGEQATATRTIRVDVTPVNDAPVNTVPSSQGIGADGRIVFSGANGNAIGISDVDAGDAVLRTTITPVVGGSVTATAANGASVEADSDGALTITGTLDQINATLNGLTYQVLFSLDTETTLTVTTSDLGNTGTGGTLTDTDTVTITGLSAFPDVLVAGTTPYDDPGHNAHLIVGDDAANTILGNGGNDRIFGLGGNDTLTGGSGNDTLEGGDGRDTLDGGTGRDTLAGGAGNDTILIRGNEAEFDTFDGGAGTDRIVRDGGGNLRLDGFSTTASIEVIDAKNKAIEGNGDANTLDFSQTRLDRVTYVDGGGGHDTIRGSSRADDLRGGSGNDALSGNGGNDTLTGGSGNDALSGNGGNDTLTGGSGNDTLEGGDGRDWLFGDAGNDSLFGGGGNDTLNGGDGADTFGWLAGDTGRDTVEDFDRGEGDVLDFSTLLVGYDAGSDTLSDYLSFKEKGSDTIVKVDADGTGPAGQTLTVTIKNVDLFDAFGVDPGADADLLAAMQNGNNLTA